MNSKTYVQTDENMNNLECTHKGQFKTFSECHLSNFGRLQHLDGNSRVSRCLKWKYQISGLSASVKTLSAGVKLRRRDRETFTHSHWVHAHTHTHKSQQLQQCTNKTPTQRLYLSIIKLLTPHSKQSNKIIRFLNSQKIINDFTKREHF